jgi:hypothetical protein
MNIYVGSVLWHERRRLRDAFGAFGAVSSVKIMDRETGRSRGFGFVEMPTKAKPKRPLHSSTAKTSADGRCASTKRGREQQRR